MERYVGGSLATPWKYERNGEVFKVDPQSRFAVKVGGTTDLGVEAAIAGIGVIHLFEDWLGRHFDSGRLEPVLSDWWQSVIVPFLYYSRRRLVPPALRAFIDYIESLTWRDVMWIRAAFEPGRTC